MQLRAFGPTGRKVVVVGQGSWNMERERAAAIAALRRGIELGMTHIDTAEMYGSGRVEEIVGEAIKGRRERLYLVSKVLPENASRKGTVEACERSLKRLGIERLDCYLLHWPGRHPLAHTIEAFEHLREAGKIASWGLSNFDAAELEKALAIAGPGKIACNQVLYHLEERAIEHEVLPWCRRHGVAVVAYSPFGSGRFPGARTDGGRALAAVAEKRSATPRQVALAFLTRDPAVFAIPKAAKAAHVEENAAADRLTLAEAEIAALERAFPRGKKRGLPML